MMGLADCRGVESHHEAVEFKINQLVGCKGLRRAKWRFARSLCLSTEAVAQPQAVLSRAFRASRGQTLAEFIAGHRFRLAQVLFKDGVGVKQAAYAAGFASPSNFATAFQREVGCVPSAYRARHYARHESAA